MSAVREVGSTTTVSSGGRPAEGLTFFADESGDPGWRPPRGKSTTRYFVLGGLILDAESENIAQSRVPHLLRTYLGSSVTADPVELRYSDLYARRGAYRRLTLDKAKEMEEEVAKLLLELRPILLATVVDKDRHQAKYGLNAYHPKEMAVVGTCQRLNMTLERLGAFAKVEMDEEQVRKDLRLRDMIHRARQTGLSFRGMSYQPRHDTTPTRINGVIHFSPSHMSSGVQLADFVSGVVWRKYERGESERFDQLDPLFDRVGGRRYEPSEVPK